MSGSSKQIGKLERKIRVLDRKNRRLKQRLNQGQPMPSAPNLGGASEGYQLAVEGAERAHNKAPDWWKEAVADAIREVCETYSVFSSDEVWWELSENNVLPPVALGFDPRAYAGCIMKARKAGWCVPFGFVKSKRPEQHYTDIRQYRSLL